MLARLLGIHQAHALPIHTEPLRDITPPFCDALASASSGQTFFSFSLDPFRCPAFCPVHSRAPVLQHEIRNRFQFVALVFPAGSYF